SPPLSVMANMKATLEGRSVGILFDTGSDGTLVDALKQAVEAEGATVKLVCPRVGGARLGDGSHRAADGQLMGTPSVVFDAIAIVLDDAAAGRLCGDPAAIEFATHAFAHLKAIAVDAGGRKLLDKAMVEPDEAVVDAADTAAFIRHARTRQWTREAMKPMPWD